MKHRRWSLRWLIGGIYFCIMVVMLGSLALYLSHVIAQNYMQTLIASLTAQARLEADKLADPADWFYQETLHIDRSPSSRAHLDPEKIASIERARADIIRVLRNIYSFMYSSHDSALGSGPRRITVLRLDGSRIAEVPPFASGMANNTLAPEVSDAFRYGVGVDIRHNETVNEEMLFVAVQIKYQVRSRPEAYTADGFQIKHTLPGESRQEGAVVPRGFLVLGAPTREVNMTVRALHRIIVLAFLGGLLVLFLLNSAISSYISRPLATLSDAADHFSHGDLARRVLPTGAAEIASLGESFNSMAEQLHTTIAHLDAQRAQAQAILACMFDGIMVTDTQGRILLINQSLERMFDMHAGTMIGKSLSDSVFHQALHDLLVQTIATRLPLMLQISFALPAERSFEVHMAPVEVGDELLGAVIAMYDITSQQRIEQIRRDFVANVSHELRTPVTSIRAMAEALLAGGREDPAMTEEFLQTTIHESERLTALLDDLLQLSRIESGRRFLSPEMDDLTQIIQEVRRRLAAAINTKSQQLVLDVPSTLPVRVDRSAVVQILINLLENARKYSPSGSTITIRAEAAPERVRLQVIDAGIGIPPHEQERIFERFYRVDKGRSRAEGGTGLGLAIVRHLVELHGGWIHVHSEQGVGSTFTVVLPQGGEEISAPGEAGEPPTDAPLTITTAHVDASD